MSVGQIVTRAEAGLRPPKYSLSGNINPQGGIAGHHGGDTELWPYSQARAATLVRGWQAFHQDAKDWADIAYNIVVDLYGRIFLCRSAGIRSAANGTDWGNYSHYAICFLAGGNDPLTDEAKLGFLAARRWLMRQDHRTGAGVVGHGDIRSTSCPGNERHAWIRRGCPEPTLIIPREQESDVPAGNHVTATLPTPSGKGRWLLQYDGGIRTEGDAKFYGSYPGLPPEHRQGQRGFYVIQPFAEGYMITGTDGALYHFPKR